MKFDLKYATVTIQGGGSPADSVEVKIGEGTLTLGIKRNIEYVKDRGLLDGTRQGDEEPIDVKFDTIWEFLKSQGSEPVTPYEALTKTGAASGWTSSGSDPCQPYAVNIIVQYDPPCEAIPGETITIRDYRWESLDPDAKAGTLNTSGKANVTLPTIVRA